MNDLTSRFINHKSYQKTIKFKIDQKKRVKNPFDASDMNILFV
jgi:hypothetical protein